MKENNNGMNLDNFVEEFPGEKNWLESIQNMSDEEKYEEYKAFVERVAELALEPGMRYTIQEPERQLMIWAREHGHDYDADILAAEREISEITSKKM